MIKKEDKNWREISRLANYWHKDGEKITCDLCPRHCSLKEGQKGFCQVRGNVKNEMHTFNYGVSVQGTIENIETEAVNHFRPGARILSMGNIGCMMACSYCQNWQTSQVKFLNDKNTFFYTPEQVVELAIKNNIEIISWTYNDPVVWQEFVVDTSRLAQKKGIKTLYKSALYIEEAPLAELIEVIDIFSVSLKGMDPKMYIKFTKGRLEPVLERIKQINKTDRHLEISQLIVTDMNDNVEDASRTAKWIIDNLGPNIPLHLVAYHPAFRYTKKRTSIETLLALRNVVVEHGIQYCYLGNIYADDVSNTKCKSCNETLVKRFGLSIEVNNINENGCCQNCNTQSPIKEPLLGESEKFKPTQFYKKQSHSHNWETSINSLHIIIGSDNKETIVKINRMPSKKIEYIKITDGLERIIISKADSNEKYIKIEVDTNNKIDYLPVLDRAHFPVKELSSASDKYLN